MENTYLCNENVRYFSTASSNGTNDCHESRHFYVQSSLVIGNLNAHPNIIFPTFSAAYLSLY